MRPRAFFVGIVAVLLSFCSPVWAKSTYGSPYYLTSGYSGTYQSVDAGVSALAAKMRGNCTTNCPTLYYYYYDNDARDSAVAARVTTEPNTSGYGVWATEYVAQSPEKNLGGCTAANGGKGGALGGSSPTRSSGDAAKESGTMCPGSNFIGDPINASNGNKYQQDTDFRDDDALTFRRFYNSNTAVLSSLIGAQWRHSFDRSLSIHDALGDNNAPVRTAAVYRPDGSVERFSKGTNGWVGAANTANIFSEQTDGSGNLVGYSLFMGGPRETERYTTAGVLQSVTDLSGAVTTFTYSTASTPAQTAPRAGLLLTVTAPTGRTLNFVYDAAGHVATVTLPDGGTLTYGYDSQGNLASVTYPDTHTRTYVYNESTLNGGTARVNAMTGLIDEKGVRFETTTYDSSGRAMSASFAGNVDTYQVTYGQLRNTATTPLGASSQLNFQSIQAQSHVIGGSAPCGADCAQPYSSISYDANGWPSAFTDFNNTTTAVTTTPAGLETQRIEAKNTTAQRTTVTTWEPIWRNPLTRSVANASGTVVAKSGWAYNARGQVTASCEMDPTIAAAASYTCSATDVAPAGVRRSTMTYCDAIDTTQCPRIGLLLSVDGPRTDVTDVTRFAYYLTTDESGCGTTGGACHRAGDLAQATNALGQVTRVLAYDKAGRVARRQDVNGVMTDFVYTPRGWLASRTVRANANGSASSADAATTLTYDATGTLHSVTDPDGVSLTYTYDDAHRLTDVTDASGNRIHYTLDAAGNRVKEETFDAAMVLRRVLARTFNTLGQLTKVTDGLGKVVFDASATGSYDAIGNLLMSKDALGTVQKSNFDALNRLVSSVANANGTDAATKATTTTFSLDALDLLKSVTDPDGLVTTYSSDGLGNPAGLASPNTGSVISTFNAAGNAITRTDALSTTSTQAFDALGRQTAVTFVDANLNVAVHYDEVNSVTGCGASFSVGRLTRIVENAITTVYCYDNQGRIVEQRQTQGTVTDTTDYVYTKAGRLAAVASPTGLVAEYGRDALGQITTVKATQASSPASVVVSGVTYLPFGPILSYTLGTGQTVSRTYDANYQATDVTSPVLALHYARDAAGNITALGNSPGASPATETYTYDPLYRLTSIKGASGTAIETYSYSHGGDRLSKAAPGTATGAYGYKASTHWLTSIGTGTRAYDANGSMTANASAGAAWGYGYNGRQQLTVVQQGGVTVATYGYNAQDQRVSKMVGSVQTRFAYDLASHLLAERGTGAARDYVWLNDVPVAMLIGTTVVFIHADELDTPRMATNASGTTVWTFDRAGNPFGERQPTSINGTVINLRFPGQYFDLEDGLVYNQHRYYDPAVGRYVQSDPVGLMAGASTYEYADSNPLRMFDFLGLATSYTGQATYYNLVGYKTASGTKFDGAAMAAAMTGEKAKLGTTVTVTYTRPDGDSVSICVTVNDRGPFARDAKGRPLKPLQPDVDDIIDLTPAAFKQLAGGLGQGRLNGVTVTVPDAGDSK